MTTAKPKLLTADDLLRLYSEGVKGELIMGVLVETVSVGGEHGEIGMRMGSKLMSFVIPRRLGRVSGTDAGVWLQNDPDVVREPDVMFISAEKLSPDERVTGYYRVIPDLVIEIASPNDRLWEVYDKARMWLSHGVTLVWVAYPDTRTVEVHENNAPVVTLTEDDTLDGGAVLPGFSLPVREVFQWGDGAI